VLFGIFDIEPNHVDRDISFVEPTLNLENVFLVEVVPPTLVIGESEKLR
jgi:hypothetical protein